MDLAALLQLQPAEVARANPGTAHVRPEAPRSTRGELQVGPSDREREDSDPPGGFRAIAPIEVPELEAVVKAPLALSGATAGGHGDAVHSLLAAHCKVGCTRTQAGGCRPPSCLDLRFIAGSCGDGDCHRHPTSRGVFFWVIL